MARNVQCPHCRRMVRIKWRFRWKLIGVSFGSVLGWLVGSFGHVIDYTFVGLSLTPGTGMILFGLIGFAGGIRADSAGVCPALLQENQCDETEIAAVCLFDQHCCFLGLLFQFVFHHLSYPVNRFVKCGGIFSQSSGELATKLAPVFSQFIPNLFFACHHLS